MINPFREINWTPGAIDLRKFAWSFIIGFPCIALVFFAVVWGKTGARPDALSFMLLGGIGAAIGLLCLAIPSLAKPLYLIWYALACCAGIVVANLLFAMLFYGMFMPIGLFMRMIGRDPLNLRFQRGTPSYWQDAEPTQPATQYFRQY